MSGRRGRNPLPFVVNSAIKRTPQWERAFGDGPTVASGAVAFTLPPGGPGQMLVAMVAYRGAPTFAMPAGWTAIHQSSNANTLNDGAGINGGFMAYKLRGASEPAPTFTRSGGSRANGWLVGYTPPSGTAAFDTFSQQLQPAATPTPETASITVTANNSLLVAMVASPTFDISTNGTMNAANIPRGANSGLAPGTPSPVRTDVWDQAFYNAHLSPSPKNTAAAWDLAGVPAGSTGTFSVFNGDGRSLMIAAAFRYS